MPREIVYEDLVKVARQMACKTLKTAGGRRTFKVEVVADAIWATPTSSGKPRRLGAGTRKAIARYNKTGSRQLLGFQGSYLLALIDIFEGIRK